MQKKIIAFLLIFVSLSAYAFAWKSSQWKIAFTEPQGWRTNKLEYGVIFNPTDGSFGFMGLNCNESQHANMTNAMAEQIASKSKNISMPKTKVLGSRIVNINGQLMVKTTMMHELSHITYDISYTTIHNHIEYTFMLNCEKQDYSKFSPVLDKMVKSAKFL